MTTIVVHGTMTISPARAYDWWYRSYRGRGFLAGVVKGLEKADGVNDLWTINGTHVSEVPALRGSDDSFLAHNGHFTWTGANQGQLRRTAGERLARYLNAIVEFDDIEPIRIVAHSHGCNVLKWATSCGALSSEVCIERMVFLACPHFTTKGGFFGAYPYRLEPGILEARSVLNLSSPSDTIQTEIAKRFSTLFAGDLREGFGLQGFSVDQDPAASRLYVNRSIETVESGKGAHSAMHGHLLGRYVGHWLAHEDFNTTQRALGGLLPVPEGDYGV